VLTLIVKARELIDGIPGNDKLTVSTAEATVTIKDVNDEPPTFNRREYNIEIPENVPDGTPLPHLDMTVKDPDVVSTGPIHYRRYYLSCTLDPECRVIPVLSLSLNFRMGIGPQHPASTRD